MPFTLRKWYVDVVTDDGRVAVAYWAALHAAGARYAVAGLVRGGAGATSSAFSLRASHGPRLLIDRLVWRAPSLGLDVSLLRLAPEVSQRLLDSPDGTVDWMAWAPAASVRLAIGDEVLEGEGYAERIDLTIAPWALPVRALHWGRWVGGPRWAVWLRWEGSHPLCLAWLDGVPVPAPRVGEDGVDLGDSGRLALSERTTVTDASIGEQLTSLTTLSALIDQVAQSRQLRWRSRGALTTPGAPAVDGWAIHEAVRWG